MRMRLVAWLLTRLVCIARWRQVRLNNLSNMLESRFERTGRIEDLEESIRRVQQTVDITSLDHPDLAGRLNSLANKLQRRFERTGRMEDLEESIRRAQQAVDITPLDDLNLAAILNNLSCKLERRFERTGRMEDLEESIRRVRQAVDATPLDDLYLANVLNNLGRMLVSRFEGTGRMEDLEESIQRARQAVLKDSILLSKIFCHESAHRPKSFAPTPCAGGHLEDRTMVRQVEVCMRQLGPRNLLQGTYL